MSQSQAERIKELADQYADAFADAKSSPWSSRLTALSQVTQRDLHTAIDEVCSEAEKLRGEVAALSKDADRLEAAMNAWGDQQVKIDALTTERDALQLKLDALEKQQPVEAVGHHL